MTKKKKNLLDNPNLQARYTLGVVRSIWHLDTVMPSDLVARGHKPEKYVDAGTNTQEITTLLSECRQLRRN